MTSLPGVPNAPDPLNEQRKARQALIDQLDSNTAVAAGGPVERIIDNRTIKFPELSFYDRRDLLREWRKEIRAEKAANLAAAGVTGPQAYIELSNFDEETRKAGEGLWVQFFESDGGKLNILAWSLRKGAALNEWGEWTPSNPQAEAEVQKVLKAISSKWPEVSRLCAVITNTPIFADTLKAPPPMPKEKQPDPTQPPSEGAGTIPTGSTAASEQGTPTPPKGFGTL